MRSKAKWGLKGRLVTRELMRHTLQATSKEAAAAVVTPQAMRKHVVGVGACQNR